MAVIKCKMCGGDMEISPDRTFGTCEYCGSTMTLPRIDDEQRAAAFNRGNHFRRVGEFDKALGVYERIVAEDDTDAEAHWCCALCRFGIEYVEDPATYEWLPTCHRLSFDSFLEDVDYLAAVEHSDGITRWQYQKDAAKIAEVQRGILATSQSAEPFDVFICYKESDENGERTHDSLLAQDIYYQLTEQGRRVFFARITLEDVAGTEYEPYIFAALNSARVMIVVGTKAEHLNAVWVKNEWSRFLSLMKKDRTKLLLPCYRDMDPYDMPEQLSILQSYDMAKIGFIQDLIRGVNKVLDAGKKPEPAKETVVVQQSGGNTEALLKRAYLFLDEGDFSSAAEYCEKVLDQDPENVRAYLGKLLSAQRVRRQEDLENCAQPFDGTAEYKRVLRFADEKLKKELEGYNAAIRERNEQERLDRLYDHAVKAMDLANSEAKFKEIALRFQAISGHKDAAAMAEQCLEKAKQCAEEAEEARKGEVYKGAVDKLNSAVTVEQCQEAIRDFETLSGWRDAAVKITAGREKIEKLRAQAEAEHQRKIDQARAAEARAARNMKIGITMTVLAVLAVATVLVVTKVIIPNNKYNEAAAMFEAGDYDGAAAAFGALGDYKDSAAQAEAVRAAKTEAENAAAYADAEALLAAGDYDGAAAAFGALGDYKDSAEQVEAAQAAKTEAENAAAYADAEALLAAGDYDGAIAAFKALGDYSDSPEQAAAAADTRDALAYAAAEELLAEEDYDGAAAAFEALGDYTDSAERVSEVVEAKNASAYAAAEALLADGDKRGAAMAFGAIRGYSDARERSLDLWSGIAVRETVVADYNRTVGLRSDGTVTAVGANGDVSGWMDIVAVYAGNEHTVGLRPDGTVVAIGGNDFGQCDVSGWKDIVEIVAGGWHTVGLCADGTVMAVGWDDHGECDVSDWTDIVAVTAGLCHTVGLRADGTVVAVGTNDNGECEVSGWTDVVAISAGEALTVGLRSDGTVVAAGKNDLGQCDVSDWTDAVAVSAGRAHTVGLRPDGTVVAVGDNAYGQCDVGGWTNIVAVSAGYFHTVGLRSDGTVVAVGNNTWGQCDVSGWSNIKLPNA